MSYDIIVAGLGAMGSATAFHLAERGQKLRILALDRHHPPHTLGSTHGGTRIIRETSFEHPRYVPLVRRAYECWRHIEAVTGRPLLRITGGLFVGPPEGPFVAKSKSSADIHGVPYEILAAAEIRRRFPAFRPEEGTVGFFEPGAGILGPEACVQACLDHAGSLGVELRFDEPLERWEADGAGVAVTTAGGGRYTAAKLLLATGPWMAGSVARVDVPLTVERIVMHWFAPVRDHAPPPFDAAQCPLALWEFEPGAAFASFPLDGGGEIKMTVHHGGQRTTPDTVRREVGAAEVAGARSLIARFLPGANGAHRRSAVCLYTNTPSGDFLIAAHPDHHQVLVASPCSGFGFKFASAIGELLADLLVEGTTKWDLEPFGLARARATSPARDTPPTSGPRAPSRPD